MFDKLVTFFLFLLHARSRGEYALKLIGLCLLVTVISVFARLFLNDPNFIEATKAAAVDFLISLFFFALGMKIAHRERTAQEQLAKMASTDLLTGLANRRAFIDQCEANGLGHLIMVDIDHFKKINDTYGHAAGDQVLMEIASFLRQNAQHAEIIARIGGEEFALVLPNEDKATAREVAANLVAGLTVTTQDTKLQVTMSAGIAYLSPKSTLTLIMAAADDALYAAKRAGRATFRIQESAVSLSGKELRTP